MNWIEVEIPIDIHIANGQTREKVFRWLNKAHVGKEEIPLDEQIPSELREASHNFTRHQHDKMIILIDKYGNKYIKNSPEGYDFMMKNIPGMRRCDGCESWKYEPEDLFKYSDSMTGNVYMFCYSCHPNY